MIISLTSTNIAETIDVFRSDVSAAIMILSSCKVPVHVCCRYMNNLASYSFYLES